MRFGLCERSLIVTFLFLVLVVPGCAEGGETVPSVGGDTSTDRADVQQQPRSGAESAGTGGEISGAPIAQDDFDRKIVKTAELGLRAEDVRLGSVRAQETAARFGGSIVSSQTYRTGNAVYADLVISVPSNQFEAALDELRGLGKEVTTDTISGQDVTEEYVDLRSRERNLLAGEQTLLDLYERADDVQDALSIQRELTDVRGQIEQVQGRIKYLDQRSDFSQISLSIRPVASPPKPRPAWDPTLVVARAWSASLAVLQTLATAVISTIVFGWWLVPALIGATWWLRRRRSSFLSPEP